MDFDKRLQRAIQRGERTADVAGQEAAAQAASEEDLRNLHGKLRLDLSEHIEACFKALAQRIPGFTFKTVVGDDGWGARLTRDDLDRKDGKLQNVYSRFEMLIRPFSDARIVELTAKGTIRNRETLKRSHYQFLAEADADSFRELIDLWVLEFAEDFAGS